MTHDGRHGDADDEQVEGCRDGHEQWVAASRDEESAADHHDEPLEPPRVLAVLEVSEAPAQLDGDERDGGHDGTEPHVLGNDRLDRTLPSDSTAK